MLQRLRIAALALAACLFAGPALAISVSTATTTAVSLASAVAGRAAHVRAYSLVAAGTTTVQFVYGTQVTNPCDTGQTALSGAMSMAANGSLSVGNGGADLITAPVGKQLCLVQTGSVQLSGFVAVSQN